MKERILREYFRAWLEDDVEAVRNTFSENVLYRECYGPEYHGLEQVIRWFQDWNTKGHVLEWTIKRVIEQRNTLVAEWYFKCEYEGEISGFDGVTIAEFDNDMKVSELLEFQSKSEHYYPYS